MKGGRRGRREGGKEKDQQPAALILFLPPFLPPFLGLRIPTPKIDTLSQIDLNRRLLPQSLPPTLPTSSHQVAGSYPNRYKAILPIHSSLPSSLLLRELFTEGRKSGRESACGLVFHLGREQQQQLREQQQPPSRQPQRGGKRRRKRWRKREQRRREQGPCERPVMVTERGRNGGREGRRGKPSDLPILLF